MERTWRQLEHRCWTSRVTFAQNGIRQHPQTHPVVLIPKQDSQVIKPVFDSHMVGPVRPQYGHLTTALSDFKSGIGMASPGDDIWYLELVLLLNPY